MAGCTAANVAQRSALAGGFTSERLPTAYYLLQTFFRSARDPRTATLDVYVEGDGRAWLTFTQPSTDPTPADPVGLKLAVADASGAAVLYVARPCQYVVALDDGCNESVWTDERFSERVTAAVSEAIDEFVRRFGAERVRIVGYSGGGTVAALVAARRSDVVQLITIAAPLDTDTWIRGHGATPLTGSLNPVDFVARLAGIDQTHLVGADDTVVPAGVLRAYLRRLGAAPNARLEVVPGFDHSCCWAARWPELSARLFR